jgi:predicted alpha/beta hydrolase family esterase
MEARAALVKERRRSKVRIASVDRAAAWQRQVCERWTTVVLQRAKQRIGIDLIARAIQITAAIIAAEIVSIRVDGAAAVEDVFARCAGIQDCVGEFKDAITKLPPSL